MEPRSGAPAQGGGTSLVGIASAVVISLFAGPGAAIGRGEQETWRPTDSTYEPVPSFTRNNQRPPRSRSDDGGNGNIPVAAPPPDSGAAPPPQHPSMEKLDQIGHVVIGVPMGSALRYSTNNREQGKGSLLKHLAGGPPRAPPI